MYAHAPFRTCHEDSEKTVLDEWGTQNAKQNKNAEILKDVKMMMGKLIQESGESYSCSTVLYINTIWGHVSMELKCVQTLRKSKVYVHATTLRSQNAEQLRENGWLRCSRKPKSFKRYDSSEFAVLEFIYGKRKNH